MRLTVLAVALFGVVLLSGCSALSFDSGPRYDVSVETVTVNDSQIRVVAIEPPEGGTLPKGAHVTVDGGHVTFTEMSTMNHRETAYLTYVPSRTEFDLTDRVRGNDHGLDAANVSVRAVRISADGETETYELSGSAVTPETASEP